MKCLLPLSFGNSIFPMFFGAAYYETSAYHRLNDVIIY